jgi:hypothetical protein
LSDQGGDPACWADQFDGSGGPPAVTVIPTLDLMAGVYRLSGEGGAESPRFRAYTEAAADRVPVHGYNPMTTKAVLPTVDALLALDAEARLTRLARRTLERIGAGGEHTMHIAVATPGMWTDRIGTEVEHRFGGRDPGAVLWWFDDLVTAEAFDAVVVAQAVRLAWTATVGPPVDLTGAVRQEGAALAVAGEVGALDDGAADVLGVLGADDSLSTMVGFLWGDNAARSAGHPPLGLGDRVGSRHAVALAHAAGWSVGR